MSNINGLVKECNISIANALKILQSCIKHELTKDNLLALVGELCDAFCEDHKVMKLWCYE